MHLNLSSVPRASRIRPLQHAEESEEFSLWNAPQLQCPTGLANNRGNYLKCASKHSNPHFWLSDYMHHYLIPVKFGWFDVISWTKHNFQLLCKTPCRRLRTLERFKRQTFFHGTTFDLTLLQRQPVEVTHECLNLASLVVQAWIRLLKKCSVWKQSEVVFRRHCPGDSGAERETRPSRQSSARPHFVSAASQGVRLRLVPQPSRHTGHTAGCQHTNSHSCTAPRPGTSIAACSGKRPTQRSVCVTDFEVTVWLLTH